MKRKTVMNKYFTYQRGQSFVELVIVIGVVMLLTVGIVIGTTTSLSRSETTQLRGEGLAIAQSGIELARQKRDEGWNMFAAMGASESTYCVGDDGTFSSPQSACTSPNVGSIFTRSVILDLITVSGVTTMKVTSRVTWGDENNETNKSELTTYLTQWASSPLP
jgi:type II secretory pathway pseudopilin PulG